MTSIYTIGYSGFKINDFLGALKANHVTCLIDVRSMPVSTHYPEYNKDVLQGTLKAQKIHYRNYSSEFGARQENPNYLSEQGFLDFEKFSKSDSFLSGFNKVIAGINQGYSFAFMCAEKDPINCHRNILVARAFYNAGYDINNILPDGQIEPQKQLEIRLLNMYFPNRDQLSLFDNENTKFLITEAYKKRNADIGYRPDGG